VLSALLSHHRVLLSATPINLANEDLYCLLRLCNRVPVADCSHGRFPVPATAAGFVPSPQT